MIRKRFVEKNRVIVEVIIDFGEKDIGFEYKAFGTWVVEYGGVVVKILEEIRRGKKSHEVS
jgi:hypothetical protein